MNKYKCIHGFISSLTKPYYFGDIIDQEEYDLLQGLEIINFVFSDDHLPYIFANVGYELKDTKEDIPEIKEIKEDSRAGVIEEDENGDYIFK